jgi:hypothetical protein
VVEQRVELPLDAPPSKAELAALKAELLVRRGPGDDFPTNHAARWAMFELAWADELERAIDSGQVPRSLTVTISAARIGDLLVVTFPLEIYSQIGLDLRQQLEPRPVIIAAYTNGLFGYAPTDRAIEQGGYGPASSYRFFPKLVTPLARGCHSILVRAATELLNAVRDR